MRNKYFYTEKLKLRKIRNGGIIKWQKTDLKN